MKIIDKTPFRSEDGTISLVDRVQATFKYGLPWYDRVQAQEKIIPLLEKHLGRNFILLRNVTLGGTDVELPMILIGPPIILLINVITEKGVFRAKEDEWGKIAGDQFVPAKTNHVARTARMGQVLQAFFNRAGLKGEIQVDSVLFSANPGTHVESVRPIVRIVMSDALERFAASVAQAKASLSPEMCATIAQVILTGKSSQQAQQIVEDGETPQSEPKDNQAFFQEEQTHSDSSLGEFSFADDQEENGPESEKDPKAKATRTKKRRIMGMTVPQLAILGGILLAWLCVVIGFIVFISLQNV